MKYNDDRKKITDALDYIEGKLASLELSEMDLKSKLKSVQTEIHTVNIAKTVLHNILSEYTKLED